MWTQLATRQQQGRHFGRSFSLPDNADAEKVNAEFNEGVLKLHIAKSEAARPKQIEVKIS